MVEVITGELCGFSVRVSSTVILVVEAGDGRKEYILIDSEREQVIRCEAEGVTISPIRLFRRQDYIGETLRARVVILSPS